MSLIVDAHQDLAWNILTFGRQYTRSVAETRRLEASTIAPRKNGDTLLGWPEYQAASVGVVFATLFAGPLRHQEGSWDKLCYADEKGAYEIYRKQLDLYHRIVDDHPDKYKLVLTGDHLEEVLAGWKGEFDQEPAIGFVISMEGAEGLRAPDALEEWWIGGVRLIGPAWAGNRYCGGTREPGELTADGYTLLEAMSDFGFGLDISHMDPKAALQALDAYPGTVIASHSNARSLLKGTTSNRHLPDRVIQGIIERDGVIGIVPLNSFLLDGWKRGDDRGQVTLAHVAAQIDYVCQMAGDSHHVGIGSDFDGGFGLQSVPDGIDSIADLVRLRSFLASRGYTGIDIDRIMGKNWLRILRRILPTAL